jgi:hypothetical protein
MTTSTIEKIKALNKLANWENIRKTEIYNEGWMLRLVLNWLSEHPNNKDFFFSKDSTWFSEASLRTYFGANKNLFGTNKTLKRDDLYETYTHADGVYGNIFIDDDNYLKLMDNCKQFVVIEAKMFSEYSPGITCDKKDKIDRYDQVARTVACMYETIEKSNVEYENMDKIAFYTFLPRDQMSKKSFQIYKNIGSAKKSVEIKVKKRIEMYSKREDYNEKQKWFERFYPFLISDKLKMELITWENILELVNEYDKSTYSGLNEFYIKCLNPNANK